MAREYYDELIAQLTKKYPGLTVYDQRPSEYKPYQPGSTFVGHTTANNPMRPTSPDNPYLSKHYTGAVGYGKDGPYMLVNKHYDEMPTGLASRNRDYGQQWAWVGDDKFRLDDTPGGDKVKGILHDVLQFHKDKGAEKFVGHGELDQSFASRAGRPKNEAMWMQNWRKKAAEIAYRVAQEQEGAAPSWEDAADGLIDEWEPSITATAAYGQDDFSSATTRPLTLDEVSEPPVPGSNADRFDFMGGAPVPPFRGTMPNYGVDADRVGAFATGGMGLDDQLPPMEGQFDFAPGYTPPEPAEELPNRFDFGTGQLLQRKAEEQQSAKDSVIGAYNEGVGSNRKRVEMEHPAAMAPPAKMPDPVPPLPTQGPMPPLPTQGPAPGVPPLPTQGPAPGMPPLPSQAPVSIGPDAAPESGGAMPPPPTQAPKSIGPAPLGPDQTDSFSTYMHGKMQGALNTGPTQYVPRNQPPVSPMNFSLAGLLKGLF